MNAADPPRPVLRDHNAQSFEIIPIPDFIVYRLRFREPLHDLGERCGTGKVPEAQKNKFRLEFETFGRIFVLGSVPERRG